VRKQDPERIIKDVGRRVAECRIGLGMTQDQLAEKLQMDTNNLQRVELGMQNLTLRTVVRLANALGEGVAVLFEAPKSRTVRKGRPPKAAR
jgi:transcriptional regulator with XRE-family HTH domain